MAAKTNDLKKIHIISKGIKKLLILAEKYYLSGEKGSMGSIGIQGSKGDDGEKGDRGKEGKPGTEYLRSGPLRTPEFPNLVVDRYAGTKQGARLFGAPMSYKPEQEWMYYKDGIIKNSYMNHCLVHNDRDNVYMDNCDLTQDKKNWNYTDNGHIESKGIQNYCLTAVKDSNNKFNVILSTCNTDLSNQKWVFY